MFISIESSSGFQFCVCYTNLGTPTVLKCYVLCFLLSFPLLFSLFLIFACASIQGFSTNLSLHSLIHRSGCYLLTALE